MDCPSCKSSIGDDLLFCTECGIKLIHIKRGSFKEFWPVLAGIFLVAVMGGVNFITGVLSSGLAALCVGAGFFVVYFAVYASRKQNRAQDKCYVVHSFRFRWWHALYVVIIAICFVVVLYSVNLVNDPEYIKQKEEEARIETMSLIPAAPVSLTNNTFISISIDDDLNQFAKVIEAKVGDSYEPENYLVYVDKYSVNVYLISYNTILVATAAVNDKAPDGAWDDAKSKIIELYTGFNSIRVSAQRYEPINIILMTEPDESDDVTPILVLHNGEVVFDIVEFAKDHPQ